MLLYTRLPSWTYDRLYPKRTEADSGGSSQPVHIHIKKAASVRKFKSFVRLVCRQFNPNNKHSVTDPGFGQEVPQNIFLASEVSQYQMRFKTHLRFRSAHIFSYQICTLSLFLVFVQAWNQ